MKKKTILIVTKKITKKNTYITASTLIKTLIEKKNQKRARWLHIF
jgi:hypothetical protein